MDEAMFWAMIARLDWERADDDRAVLQPLVDALARLPERDICRFDDLLAEKLHALDGEPWARASGAHALQPGGAPDPFLHGRCYAVAAGRAFYLQVLGDPARMPNDCTFAALLDAAGDAFAQRTGGLYDHVPRIRIGSGSNPAGWPRGR